MFLFPSSCIGWTIAQNPQDGFILAITVSHSGMDVVYFSAAFNVFYEIRCPLAQGVQRASSGD